MRSEKETMFNEVKSRIAASDFVAVVNYHGMKTAQTQELRRRLKSAGFEFHVAPNFMIGRAIADLGWGEPDTAMLTGPCGLITGQGEPPQTAGIITGFFAEIKTTPVKGGYFEGRMLDGAQINALATLPSKDVLRAMVVGALSAPMTRLVTVLKQAPAGLLYALKAFHDKKTASSE